MFRHAPYSRAVAADMAEIERRLRSLEKRLERTGGSISSSAAQAMDRGSEVFANTLSDLADRFRGINAGAVGSEALKFGNAAAQVGNDVVRRVANEVERRPLTALAVVAGIGILLGLSSRRH
jgi:ElaB/YqjD/DUF883 family membrane-anchored ribosome-binding protein